MSRVGHTIPIKRERTGSDASDTSTKSCQSALSNGSVASLSERFSWDPAVSATERASQAEARAAASKEGKAAKRGLEAEKKRQKKAQQAKETGA